MKRGNYLLVHHVVIGFHHSIRIVGCLFRSFFPFYRNFSWICWSMMSDWRANRNGWSKSLQRIQSIGSIAALGVVVGPSFHPFGQWQLQRWRLMKVSFFLVWMFYWTLIELLMKNLPEFRIIYGVIRHLAPSDGEVSCRGRIIICLWWETMAIESYEILFEDFIILMLELKCLWHPYINVLY